MARFRRGTMFLNRYVLLEPIGQGSVSVVYQAEDTLNNRQVAIKLLEPSLADNRRAQERLRRPTEIMALLSDAGVPRVYEAGTAPLGDGSALGYCVMELLTGEALDSRLARGPLSWLQAVRVAATIADVLTLAHAQSIALRVLGPTGVLLTADGAKIVDFDAAMVVVPPPPTPPPAPPAGSGGSRRKRGSAAPAPRADRGAVAIATLAAEDVYALGCLLDHMLGGSGPGAGLPAPLVELLLRCLSEPAHRPDAATLSMELWGMLTPDVAPPSPPSSSSSSSFEDGPLSVPMSLNLAAGRHSAAVAALESRSSVESRMTDSYASDSYASDSYASDSHDASSHGTGAYDASSYGAEFTGAATYGASSYGSESYGAESHATDFNGAEPYGASSYGAEFYGAESYGAESYGAESYGADSYGAESHASESRASAESAAQARGALARAAVDRSRRDHPVEQVAYRPASEATASASLLDAVSPGGAALLGGRTSARGGRTPGAPVGGAPGGRASRVHGAAGNAVAAALNGRAAALDAVAVDAHLATAAPVNLAGSDAAEYSIVTGTDGAGYAIVAESEDARHSVVTGSDTIAGHGPGAVGSAPDSRIPVPRDRDRAAGPQQTPVGHSGQGGRHRRRRPAWTAPTGQANALS